nr:hypothetical protein [Bacteroidota bacterium]
MVFRKVENENFDATNIVLFLHKWRKPLIIVTAVAILVSVIFSSSYFITPKFKSTVILYPAATNAISKALLTENTGSQENILGFGEDEETEQMLQILHSNRIRDKIIRKYNLMGHYDIEFDSKYKLTRLYKEYESNISFRRTEFMAIKISVLDKDPQMAADIANDIAELLDSTKNEMQKKRAQRAFEIVQEQYLKLHDEVKVMEDSLTKLRELGVNDYESQSEMINQQLAMELAKGNVAGVNRLEAKLDILAKYGGPYVSIRDAIEHEKKQLSMLRAKFEEAKTDANEILPTKFIVNSAYKAEQKSYPIRWLIVVISTISVFILMLIIILVLENIHRYLPVLEVFNDVKEITDTTDKESTKYKSIPEPEPPAQQKVFQSQVKEPKVVAERVPIPITPAINQKQRNEQFESSIADNSNPEENESFSDAKNENQMERYFTNMNILKLLFKWRIHLGAIVLLGIILAAIFSGPAFITPRFKSFAVVYPSNLQSYSEESESEQMLQWFQSSAIMNHIIKTFDLGERYGIDTSYQYYQSTVQYFYHENVKIAKTPFEAIQIEVFDKDPYVACAMVDSIISFFNKLVLKKHAEKYAETLDLMKYRLQLKELEMDSVAKALYTLRTKYEIVDYPNQSREVARGYLKTVDGDNSSGINTSAVMRLKKNIEEKGGEWTKYN